MCRMESQERDNERKEGLLMTRRWGLICWEKLKGGPTSVSLELPVVPAARAALGHGCAQHWRVPRPWRTVNSSLRSHAADVQPNSHVSSAGMLHARCAISTRLGAPLSIGRALGMVSRWPERMSRKAQRYRQSNPCGNIVKKALPLPP